VNSYGADPEIKASLENTKNAEALWKTDMKVTYQ
jgi:hypothetical protein